MGKRQKNTETLIKDGAFKVSILFLNKAWSSACSAGQDGAHLLRNSLDCVAKVLRLIHLFICQDIYKLIQTAEHNIYSFDSPISSSKCPVVSTFCC